MYGKYVRIFVSVPLGRRTEIFQIYFEREECTNTYFKLRDNLLMSDVAGRIDARLEIVKQNYVLRYNMVYFYCDIFQPRLIVKSYRVI